MAIAIKNIPVLQDSNAKAFLKKANDNASNESATINFSAQVKSATKILEKAKKKL